MATPRGVEFNEHNVFSSLNCSIKVRISKHKNILVCGWALLLLSIRGTATLRRRWRGFATFTLRSSVDFGGNLLKGKFSDWCSVSSRFISFWILFVKTEELDGWESGNSVWRAKWLVLVHIYGSHIDDTFQIFSCFGPLRCKLLTVAAPRGVKLN